MSEYIFTIASGKGGVGKTLTAVNLAVNFRMRDRSVVLVDGDLGMPNVGEWFDIEHGLTLHDVLADKQNLADAITKIASGFAILAGDAELSGFADADPSRFAYVVDRLDREFDYVIIDTGGGLSYENALPLRLSDETILVTSPDPPAIGDTKRTRDLINLIDGEIRGVIVTKTTESTNGYQIATELGVTFLGTVPFSKAIEEATRATTPLELFDPGSDAAQAYRDIAGTLLAREEPLVGDSVGP